MTRKERKVVSKKKFPLGMGILLTCFALILGNNTATLARYLLQYESGGGQVTASAFYFTGDPSLTNTSNTVTDLVLGETIRFYNYDKNNESLITQENIAYGTTITYYTGETSIGEPMTSTGILNGGTENSGTIKLAYQEGATHAIVTVQSTAPYRKTLSARFNFETSPPEKIASVNLQEGSDRATYTVEDQGDSVSLVIVAGDMEVIDLPILWDINAFVPDTTQTSMGSWESSSGEESISMDAHSTETFRFYKYDPSILYTEVKATVSDLGIRITNTKS